MLFTRENKLDQANQSNEEAVWMVQAARDTTSFGPIYERYFERIFKYCYRRVGQLEEAEDLTAKVFTNALRNLAGYRGGSVAAWLFQIAHNVVLNHLRSSRHNLPLEQNRQIEEMPQPSKSTLEHLIQMEEWQLVQTLVEVLPEEQKELLALSLIDGLTSGEIGQVVGKSGPAVRMALHRTIKQLREAYRKAEKFEEGKK